MFRTITAEFDSLDTAERAAHAIKSNLDGINDITIKSTKHSTKTEPDTVMSLTGNLYPYNNGYFGSQAIASFPFYSEIKRTYEGYNSDGDKYSAEMAVTCSNDSIKNVSSMMTSYGGLNISQ